MNRQSALLPEQVYGLVERPEHSSTLGKFRLHPQAHDAFLHLQADASEAGIDLQIASGFRSFERQLSIWNRKLSGELAVLGDHGNVLDVRTLTERERVFAVLRWSALPGASRHHWGTDMDVYDAAVMLPEGYRLQLTEQEAHDYFHHLHHWLDERVANNTAHDFFRPYAQDHGGIAPELWHLSYAPVANIFQKAFSIDELADILRTTDIALKNVILENLPEIYQRFIAVSQGMM
jgi:LAS superfamily LD-carboxypeptidase LdcB